ncbi:MAG: acyloxyacyl hydrolase [Gemmatimonadetes bacterium]|nr:acyloxyacyl hydrolase [Gemmatimonadota bacterium]
MKRITENRSIRRFVQALALMAAVLLGWMGAPSGATAQDPAVFYIGGAALAAVVPGFLFDTPQPDAGQAYLKTSLGRFDAVDQENMALDFLVEYQPGLTWHRIKPLFGVAGNSDGTIYGWVSIAHDFHLAERLVVNVNTGPAMYIAGEEGKELGSSGALRSGFEIGYRFYAGARVTGSFHHMSHGKLLNHDLNPGTEVIALNVSWPIG